jgi:hypothetical protein
MKLALSKKEKNLLLLAVENYRDIPDFRDPGVSDDMKLLRAKVLVAVKTEGEDEV